MPARSTCTLPPEQDDFEWSKVKYYVLYVLAFALGTWTNMKVLQTANVETVIVFRSCCPIVVAGFDYQWARDEFLDERGADQPFPLNGRYRATTLNLGLRAGFTDRFELELQVPFKLVSYPSDTVILLEPPMPTGSDLDFYQENVIDLSRTRQGIGDIWFTGRYNLARWPVAVAIEGRLKTPTGYDGPAGTFGDDPQTAEAFLDGVGELVRTQ